MLRPEHLESPRVPASAAPYVYELLWRSTPWPLLAHFCGIERGVLEGLGRAVEGIRRGERGAGLFRVHLARMRPLRSTPVIFYTIYRKVDCIYTPFKDSGTVFRQPL